MSNGTPRRRSIFSGLLLILLGGLFLLHYRAPELVNLGGLARYWPLLLILWGVAKLYDHLSAQRAGQAPPRGLTGGEFLLLVLLIGFGAFAVILDWAHRKNPDLDISIGLFEHTYTFTSELPATTVKPDAAVAVSTPRGNITIRSEDVPELRVMVTKTARVSWFGIGSSSPHDAERLAEKVHVAIREAAGGYEVQAEAPEEAGGVQVSLEVHAPRQAGVSAKTGHGSITIADRAAAVAAVSGNGDIEVQNAGGDVSADLRHGDARITGVHGDARITGSGAEIELADVSGAATINGEFYGPVRIHNVAGTTHFTSSRTELTLGTLPGRLEMDMGGLEIYDTPASVSLATKNKDIEMENVGGRIRIANRHGDIKVRFAQPPREEVNIEDDSGSVDVTLPATSSCEITALSHSGEIENDFQTPTLKLVQERDNSRLEGKLGARGPQIRITTSYGTIYIRKAA